MRSVPTVLVTITMVTSSVAVTNNVSKRDTVLVMRNARMAKAATNRVAVISSVAAINRVSRVVTSNVAATSRVSRVVTNSVVAMAIGNMLQAMTLRPNTI